MPRAGYPRRGAEATKTSLRHIEYQRLDNKPSANSQISRHGSSKTGWQWLCQVSVIVFVQCLLLLWTQTCYYVTWISQMR